MRSSSWNDITARKLRLGSNGYIIEEQRIWTRRELRMNLLVSMLPIMPPNSWPWQPKPERHVVGFSENAEKSCEINGV
jgi:hypothetical protein